MSQGFKVNKRGGIIYFTVQSFSEQGGVVHAFSTRHGGVSSPPFASLNLGFHFGDDPASVQENRRRFCKAVGLEPAETVTAEQVHGDHVQVVTLNQAGAGALTLSGSIPATDAMITRDKIALMAFFADCVPILIYDPGRRAVGIAHSGWKGTLLEVGRKTIEAMVKEFGSNPADCLIAIGPSIGPCCYEVDDRVIAEVKAAFPYWQDLVEDKGSGRWNLDLWAANRQSLIEAGVAAEKIAVSGMCTCCNQDMLYSYRGEKGSTGRLAAVIRLE